LLLCQIVVTGYESEEVMYPILDMRRYFNSAKNLLTHIHIVNTEEITFHRKHLRWLPKFKNRLGVADEMGRSRVQMIFSERILRPRTYCLQIASTECATPAIPHKNSEPCNNSQAIKEQAEYCVHRTCQASCRSGARWR